MIQRKIVPFVFFFLAGGLFAWDIDHTFGSNFAYYLGNHGGYPEGGGFLAPSYSLMDPADDSDWQDAHPGTSADDSEVRELGSIWGAVRAEGYYRFRATTPFLAGNGDLTKGNNLQIVVKPILTPVSVHVENEVHFTPIAFLKFSAGISLGVGWPLDALDAHGLALNNQNNIDNTTVSGFAGHYYLGGTLQFDLAAVVPGDMNHVVFSLSSKARYMHYSAAEKGDAWYWRTVENNFNGWEYQGDYALGWQPPWKINFIGLVAEHRFWLSKDIRESSTIDDGGWGSDLQEWHFGPAMGIDLENGHSLLVLLQFRNGLYYTKDSIYWRWFQEWEATGDKYITMERLALAYSWKM